MKLALDHDLDPAQMALAWVNSNAFTTSLIIRMTSLQQLGSNLGSIDVELSMKWWRVLSPLIWGFLILVLDLEIN